MTVFKPDLKWYLAAAMIICWGMLLHRVKFDTVLILVDVSVLSYHYPTALTVIPAFIVAISLAPRYENYIHQEL